LNPFVCPLSQYIRVKKGETLSMTLKTFTLFRHGQTDWNLERRCQGHTNIALNEHGRQQARGLADFLKGFPLEVIFSSDLDRARETAEWVSKHHSGIEVRTTNLLREGHLGEAEGMKIDEIKEKFGKERWDSFRHQNGNWLDLSFPGGETRRESLGRVRKFVEGLIEHPEQNIALSTHGGVMRSLLHSFLPDGHPALDIPNCVVYQLIFEAGEWQVKGPIFPA